MPNVLRWIVLLPAALGAMMVVRILYRLIINIFMGPSSGAIAMLDEFFVTATATGAYLYAGTHIAPSHKYAAAIALSLIYSVFSMVVLVLVLTRYGNIMQDVGADYSSWGIVVAIATCVAYCARMTKKKASL